MATLAENAQAIKQAQEDIDTAIVAKGGTTLGGLANAGAAIATIPVNEGPSWDQVVNKSYSGSMTSDSVLCPQECMYNWKLLKSVTMTRAQYISQSAFQSCNNLSSATLREATKLMSNCFNAAGSQAVELVMTCPKVTEIYSNAFNGSHVHDMRLPAYAGTGMVNSAFTGAGQLSGLHFAASNRAAVEADPNFANQWGLGAGTATITFEL